MDLNEAAQQVDGWQARPPKATGYAALTAEGIKLWWLAQGNGAGICWQTGDEHRAEMKGEQHG